MTSTYFTDCPLSERIRIILRTGIFLNFIEYQNFEIQLYSISNFFAEVKISTEGRDVESIRVITGEDVEKFIADVKLPASI